MRIRTVKPELFRHEALFDAEQETGLPLRLAFIGLFCVADREGRFKWRPRALKVSVLPYDDCDFSCVLDALLLREFLIKYRVDGHDYGAIPTFKKHQQLNPRESASDIPPPPDGVEVARVDDACLTRASRVDDACKSFLWGREGKGRSTGKESISTEPLGGSRADARDELDNPEPAVDDAETGAAPAPSVALAEFPLRAKGQTWDLPQAKFDEWQETWADVDVMGECIKARQWLRDNPDRRKTARGMLKFLSGWIGRAIDRGSAGSRNGRRPPEGPGELDPDDPYPELSDEEQARLIEAYEAAGRQRQESES